MIRVFRPTCPGKAFSACTAIALVAGFGFTTLAMTSTASAQETPRQQANNSNENQFPTEQAMEEGLMFAVAGGELSEQQASSLMRVYKRLAMGIENEKLSVNEALAILEERAKVIYGEEQGITRQDYADAHATMQKMVDAGEITQQQMDEKLIEMRKMIGQGARRSKSARKDVAGEQGTMQMSDIVIKVTTALENGEITTSQAAQYIRMAQESIMAEQAYEEFETEVVAAYEAGEIDRRQAGEKLESFKKELSNKMLEQCAARMNAAVEEGTMTTAEVEEVWTVYKTMNDGGKEEQITRKDYADAQARMQKMVDAGEITREQMKTRLGEMRKMIGKSKIREQPQLTREDYAEAQAKMQKMVDTGEITEEQMDARLGEMRRMIGRANRQRKAADAGRDEVSVDCMELRRTLGEAIRSGKMTREEAGEIWKAEGC